MREEEEGRKEGRKEAEITNSQQTVTANRDDKMGWAAPLEEEEEGGG